MKRILHLMKTATVMAAMLCAAMGTAHAQTSGTTGTLTWEIVDGTLTISGNGAMPDYTYYNPNTAASPWSRSNTTISTVIIGDGVTSIGNYALCNFSNLTSITIPNSVTSIGEGAFSRCSSLTSVTIPNSVTSIGEGAFSRCSSLTSITIPESVTSIGSHAFNECDNLTSVTIPESVTTIGDQAFLNCDNLATINGPRKWAITNGTLTITGEGDMADYEKPNNTPWYSQRQSITAVVIGAGVTSIGEGAFSGCSSLTSITIPESVTTIGEGAFSGCSGLTSVTIPNSVTSIGSFAFFSCDKLTEVFNYAITPQTIEDNVFGWINLSGCALRVPEGTLAAYRAADVWKNFGSISIIVPVTGININDTEFTLKVDEYKMFEATVLPANASNKNVTWSSNNPTVATVDKTTGLVTAIAKGTTTITVTTVDGGFKATCTVTVIQPVTGINLNKTELTLKVDETETLGANILPANANNKNVTWSSSDNAIATVSETTGLVTAVSKGEATITATTVDGEFKATCTITVIQQVTGVNLVKSELTLKVDETETLEATVLPANANNKTVTWSSSDNAIAMVNRTTGLVAAVSRGEVTITATTEDGEFKATCSVTVIQPVTGVEINETEFTLKVGAAETLEATVLPANANNQTVTWSSSNNAIATVSETTGLVTAVSKGEATITATTADGGFKATCTVTVIQQVTGVNLNKTELSLKVDDAETLKATVLPANANNQSITWSSSDHAIATVNETTGIVTAIAKGTTTITVTAADGEFTATCTVTVIQPVTGVNLVKPELTLKVGETETLKASVLPANANNQNVTWSSSNNAIATVSETTGFVTAVSKGEATITATTADGGFKATCAVTVIQQVTGINLNKPELTLKVGETETLEATVLPANANNKTVTWSSNDNTIAAVNETTGLVIAVSRGEATITATTEDGEFTATCVVTVIQQVTGINLNKTELTLIVGKTETLEAIVLPANANNKTVTWSSSDHAIATVTETTGLVTAVSKGEATITATTADGEFKATCIVAVTQLVDGVNLNKTRLTLKVDETEMLEATVLPANANNQTVTWSSSDDAIAAVTETTGLVTAVSKGEATITATTVDGEFKATCTVTVTQPVTGVNLVKTRLSLKVGETGTLEATVLPANANNKTVTWSSNNNVVAMVNRTTGQITAVSRGEAVITATTEDGGFKATCTVTVTQPVTGVEINKTELTLKVGVAETLEATVLPANANNQTVTWSSSDHAIAAVDGTTGLVTAVSKGEAVITVTTVDGGFKATCTVTITQPVTGVNLVKTRLSLKVGETGTLEPIILPANANNQTVTWSSNNNAVAMVNGTTGLVTAASRGEATITATTVDGEFKATCTVTVTQQVTGVNLYQTELTLKVGETETLEATVLPANANNQTVTWSSSDHAIAAVDGTTGLVTAVSKGEATITATTVDGCVTATCTVTVTQPVTGVNLVKTRLSLKVGETGTLEPIILPANANNKTVTWSSSDRAIATVNGTTGLVTAVKKGEATITATTVDGGFTATCTVTVTQPVAGVNLYKTKLTLKVGENEVLIASVLPANANNQKVTWSSSNNAVATVNETTGLVTAVSRGEATITATTDDGGKTATCTVTVIQPVVGVHLNKTEFTLNIGTAETLVATVLPVSANNQKVTWSSSDNTVAAVNQTTGLVTAIKKGEATITATTVDGGFKATCTVTVTQPVTAVTLNKTKLTLNVGENEVLVATVLPVSANNQTVTWSSSNNAIVAVNSTGLVTAVSAGTAIIVVTTTDGNRTAICTVTVITPGTTGVTGVTVSPATVEVQKGKTQQFTADVTAIGGVSRAVAWSVSGNALVATNINAAGLLTVAAGETATALTVTATSTFDNTKKGTASVTVTSTPVTPSVTSVTVTPATATVQKGKTQRFTANVTALGGASTAITWSVTGNTSATTGINATGLLTVSAGETATVLTVTATSVFDNTKKGTASVTVTGTPVTPSVTSVTVTPATASVQKGGMQQFTANVIATGDASETVTWMVSGNTLVATNIDATGLLTVAAGETVTTLTVTATSVFDNTKKGTASVTVTSTPVTPSVTSVTVIPATASVQKGKTQQFTANVTAMGGASEAVTWSVSGNMLTATNIDATGLLTVAAGETATTLTVTATSDFDNTQKSTASVTVESITGTPELFAPDLKVYPNPFTGTVHLTGAEGCTLRVINTAGTTVHVQNIESPDETIRLEQLPAGMFFFRIEKEGRTKTVKTIKN